MNLKNVHKYILKIIQNKKLYNNKFKLINNINEKNNS